MPPIRATPPRRGTAGPASHPPGSRSRAGDLTSPVGLPPPVKLGVVERETLLDLARAAVAVAAGVTPPAALEAGLRRAADRGRKAAAFVTLTSAGELRGCMGTLDPDGRVEVSVAEAATWAARSDPRFRGVEPRDLPDLEIEVSVLGPMVPLADPEGFRLGIDGIVVRSGSRRGLLLPEVALMLGNDRLAMLDTCCRKAGLPAGAWREPATMVLAFRTDRFGGSAVRASESLSRPIPPG